jgi:hypothetical protein
MARALLVGLTLLLAAPSIAKPLTAEQKLAIDAAVIRILKATEVSSASIAIVTDGKLDYAHAYGDQRLDGSTATTAARYPLASPNIFPLSQAQIPSPSGNCSVTLPATATTGRRISNSRP